MAYTDSEAALVALITTMTGYTADNTKSGDADSVFKYSNLNGVNCCVVDFAGARGDDQTDRFGAYKNILWESLVSFFVVLDRATIETSLRTLLDGFVALNRDNKRLPNGVTWRILDVRAFGEYKTKLSNRSYVPVTFMVELKEPL